MRKKVLLTGLMMATMLTISACGSKNTTETTTAVTTTIADTTTEERPITDGESESTVSEELTADQIKTFAEEVQAAVAGQDINWLADLISYPAYVSMEDGEYLDIKSKEDFVKLGEDKIFIDRLKEQIAAVKPEELEMFGAGVMMGEDASITFSNVDGEPAIIGIIL